MRLGLRQKMIVLRLHVGVALVGLGLEHCIRWGWLVLLFHQILVGKADKAEPMSPPTSGVLACCLGLPT